MFSSNSARRGLWMPPVLLALGGLSSTAAADNAMGGSAVSDKAFNPAISLILDGQFASYSNGDKVRDIPGFQLGKEAGGFAEGLVLNESELNLSASIDDKFYAASTISFASDGGETAVDVEEVYFQTLALPAGLQIKAGRFFSGIGYINAVHGHATAFVDDPLPYRVLLDGRLADTGIQLTWTAPTILYLRLGTELFSGNSFPAAGAADSGTGTRSLFAKLGGDFNASNSWLASLSRVWADTLDRRSGGTADETGVDPLFTGNSDTWIASLVWKWSPGGNPRNRNFRLTAEYLSRNEDGRVTLGPEFGSYSGDQWGYYIEGVYRFHPQWGVGIRYDALAADNVVGGVTTPIPLMQDTFKPKRITAMVDFWNSEFSTLRLQYARDESNPVGDNQFTLQYIMSMGAHGAHTF
jgi:hypothetical protein